MFPYTERVDNETYHYAEPYRSMISSGVINAAHVDLALASDRLFLKEKQPQTDAMLLGSITHVLALEGAEEFERLYAVIPSDIDRRTKIGKEKYAEWALKSEGKTQVKSKVYEQALQMATVALAQPVSNSKTLGDVVLAGEGEAEATILWDEGGIPCKARPDFLGGGYIVDLKTARDPWDFENDIIRRGYHISAAHYRRGLYEKTGIVARWIWVVVGSGEPYSGRSLIADEALLELGESERAHSFEKIKEANYSGRWSEANANRLVTASVPSWYRSRVPHENTDPGPIAFTNKLQTN